MFEFVCTLVYGLLWFALICLICFNGFGVLLLLLSGRFGCFLEDFLVWVWFDVGFCLFVV